MTAKSDNIQGPDTESGSCQKKSSGKGWFVQGLVLLGIGAIAAVAGFLISHFLSAGAEPPPLAQADFQEEPAPQPAPPFGDATVPSEHPSGPKEAVSRSLPAETAFSPVQPMNRGSQIAAASSPELPLPTTTAAVIEEVHEVVDRLVHSFPNQPDAFETKARMELWRGNTAEAQKSWKRCLEGNPNYEYAYYGLGAIAADKGDCAVAADWFRKALALDPTSSETRVQLGHALINTGQPKEAITVLEHDIASDRTPTRRFVLLGMASMQIADYAMAKAYYEAAIRNDPNHANAYKGLTDACLRLGLKDESRKYLEKFNQLRSEEQEIRKDQRAGYDDLVAARVQAAIFLTDAGRVYLVRKQPSEAERLCKRAAALDPKAVSCRQALAWLLYQQGRTGMAAAVLREIAALEPKNPVYPLEIGRLLVQLRELNAAEVAFQQARTLAPQDPQTHATLAEFYLASDRKLPEALSLARKAVDLHNSAGNYARLALACEKNGDLPGAVAAIEQAVRREPGNTQYRTMYERLHNKK